MNTYALEGRINGQWDRIAVSDSIADLKRDAANWTLEYRIIDTDRDRYNVLDVGPRHCRLTKWVAA
jgi:hypothetical protein